MSFIKFINKNLFTVNVSEYIKDGASYSNIDLKTVATAEGKTKNVCRVAVPGANAEGPGSIESVEQFIEAYGDKMYDAVNSLIEKYHNITTSLKLASDGATSSVFYIAAIPYNGNVNSLTVTASPKNPAMLDYTGNPVQIINATTLKTESFAMSQKSKLKFAKILYLIFWGLDSDNDMYTIEMSTTSYPKTDEGTIKVDRQLRLEIADIDNIDNAIPTVVETTKSDVITEDEINVTKFNQLFTNVNTEHAQSVGITAHADATAPYAIEYSNVIKEKRNTNGNNRRNGNSGGFKLDINRATDNKNGNSGKYRNNRNYGTDDATKKAHAHAKSVNKLNKAKDKFAE